MAESSDSFFSIHSQNQASQEDDDFLLGEHGILGFIDHNNDSFDTLQHAFSSGSSEQSDNLPGSSNPQDRSLSQMPPRAPGGERAPKRRRLNNGNASRTGGSRENSIDLTDDSPTGHSRHSNPLPPSRLNNASSLDLTVDPQSVSRTSQATQINILNPDIDVVLQPFNMSSSNRVNIQPIPGPTRGGIAQTTGATATSTSLQSGYNQAGGLEAIDLTGVIDTESLRQREQLDDEQRRMKREASMKIEARRKANEQMLRSALAAQQADATKDLSGHKGMGAMQCVICMDSFTDMTATPCGHLFCHTCINEHLITAEMSIVHKASLCPFCRQQIVRKKTLIKDSNKTIVPLSFKVKSKDASIDKGKQKKVELPD